MRYKITVQDKKYIVTAKDAKTALEALSEFEDGVSPMTYKKLKEQGYNREDWQNWSDQEKFEKSQSEEETIQSSKNNASEEPSELNRTEGLARMRGNVSDITYSYKGDKFEFRETKSSAEGFIRGDDGKMDVSFYGTKERNGDIDYSIFSGSGKLVENVLVKKGESLSKLFNAAQKYKAQKTDATKVAQTYNDFANSNDTQELVSRIKSSDAQVPLEELRNNPVIKQMDKMIDEYNASIVDRINSGVVIPLEEQEQIKKELLSRGSVSGVNERGDAIYGGPVKHERKAVIAIGLPAAGKSTRIVNKLSGPMGAFVVDSDEAKFLSKEFQETNGVAGGAIHKNSQQIIKQVFNEQVKNGTNMIIPVIGSDYDKLFDKWINTLERQGYDVEVQFQDANPVQSANRVVSRAISKKRPIHSDVIFEYGDKPREVFKLFEGKLNAQGKPYTNRNQNNI